MHSFHWAGNAWKEQGSGEVYVEVLMHHNGDYSGNVKVVLPNKIADTTLAHGAGPNGEGMAEVHIPFEALKALIMQYVRSEMVSQIEQATNSELIQFMRWIH